MFLADPSFGSHERYAAIPSGERIKVAEVTAGKLSIFDETLFAKATGKGSRAEAKVTSETVITVELINRFTFALEPKRAQFVRSVLQKYLGLTWKAALDAHSLEKGSTSGEHQ